MSYAVIDFETTGVMPERGDRVVEIGVVLTDTNGHIEQEWSTLINPQRDVGASDIHGLSARDLLDAPRFSDIADELLRLVSGRTVAAHNAVFDMRFLHSELQRAGYQLPERPEALCTMKWSGRLIGPAKLEQCCEALGIHLTHAHSALDDARAAAQLIPHFLGMVPVVSEWENDVLRSRVFGWPGLQGRPSVSLMKRSSAGEKVDAWLDSVLEATWIPGVPEDEAAYLLVLDRALLDRKISITEGRQLVEVATSAGLSGESVARLHIAYLRSIATEALSDGVVTSQELTELESIASALRLTTRDIREALEWASTNTKPTITTGLFQLEPGDRIVFTGATSRPRDQWVATIVGAGLASGGVTKSTKLLVAADPDSMSGKAAKARKYGIPVVDEATFERHFENYLSSRM